jgi:predicted nucleotidyltransferase
VVATRVLRRGCTPHPDDELTVASGLSGLDTWGLDPSIIPTLRRSGRYYVPSRVDLFQSEREDYSIGPPCWTNCPHGALCRRPAGLGGKNRLDLKLELHRRHQSHEVVLLDAASQEALRKTHGRYFEDVAGLPAAMAGTLAARSNSEPAQKLPPGSQPGADRVKSGRKSIRRARSSDGQSGSSEAAGRWFEKPRMRYSMSPPQDENEALFNSARDAVLRALPDVWAIYVYGSFARGEAWPGSDLDIAILLPPGRSIPDLLDLIGAISQRTGRDVDVADLRRAGDVLRREVLESGRTVFQADPDQVLAWEASALTRYGHYRQEVRGILEEFRRTGIGYGP